MLPARLAVLAVVGCVVACAKDSQPAATTDLRTADAATIRGLDSAWAKAMATKNGEKIAAFYADTASLLAPGDSLASGRGAILKTWTAFAALPGFALTFQPTKLNVAGDLAYEVGDYALTLNDKTGKPQTSKGKYVVVWGKQADGSWKAVVDAPTTTQ